jgi:hypothetical protein
MTILEKMLLTLAAAVLLASMFVKPPLTVYADGSDPMPLCRAKGCGPIKGK